MLARRVLLGGLLSLACAEAGAQAPLPVRPRIRCLTIGNSYFNAPVPPLSLAGGDATLMFERFHDIPNSDPRILLDTSRDNIFKAIRKLTAGESIDAVEDDDDPARPSDVFLFYYAGHGVQISDHHSGNALVTIERTDDPDNDNIDFISVAEIVQTFRERRELRNTPLFLFLDACRDNPFSSQEDIPANRFGIDRTSDGLALPNIPGRNLLFCYSTNPGDRTADACPSEGLRRNLLLRQLRCDTWSGGANGPFAAMLSQHILSRVSMSAMLTSTRSDVSAITYGEQIPWIFSSMVEEHYLNGYPLISPP